MSFSSVSPISNMLCTLCGDPLNSDVVSHNGLHPNHRKCLVKFTQTFPSCPICKTEIDRSTIYTLKDRATIIYREGYIPASLFLGSSMGSFLTLGYFAEDDEWAKQHFQYRFVPIFIAGVLSCIPMFFFSEKTSPHATRLRKLAWLAAGGVAGSVITVL